MCVYMKICVFFNRICVFSLKNNKKPKKKRRRPTDLGTDAARAVGRSAALFLFLLGLFIYKHTYFNIKHTYFYINTHILI